MRELKLPTKLHRERISKIIYTKGVGVWGRGVEHQKSRQGNSFKRKKNIHFHFSKHRMYFYKLFHFHCVFFPTFQINAVKILVKIQTVKIIHYLQLVTLRYDFKKGINFKKILNYEYKGIVSFSLISWSHQSCIVRG